MTSVSKNVYIDKLNDIVKYKKLQKNQNEDLVLSCVHLLI